MVKNIYAVKDTKSSCFLNPTYDSNDDVAKRNLNYLVNVVNESMIYQYPEDYELWCIGSYDDLTAIIISDIRFVCQAKELKNA